jgi:signal transduction histidine kinase
MGSSRVSVLAVSAVSAAVTVAAALHPLPDFTDRLPALRVALATALPLIALVAGLLILGRLLRRSCLTELALACSLGVLALSELAFVTIPVLLGRVQPDLTVWGALAGCACGAALFAVAAFAPRRRIRRLRLVLGASGAAMAAILLLIAVVEVSSAGRLPKATAGTAQNLAAMTAQNLWARPDPHADAVLPVLEIAIAAIYALAAVGFLRRRERSHDEFFGWLAGAAVLAAAAFVNSFLNQDSYLQPVSIGDVFRLCFYVVLLAGSALEIWSYWHAVSEAAVLEERRRIARDLHDGPAQELTYLLRHLNSLDGTVDKETKAGLRHAAERAQLEVRLAINTLTASRRQSVNAAIARAVGEVAARDHIKLELDVVPGIWLSPTRAEALVRIACEAVGNAAHHSRAEHVSLSVRRHGSRVRLRVSDDGSGFDPAVSAGGFGLISMHDRASSVGGDLRISSGPGRGTEVEATL